MCVHHRAKPNTERISKTLQEKNTKTPVQIKKQNKTKPNPHNQLRHNSRFPPKWLPAPCGSLRQEKRCRKALMQPPGQQRGGVGSRAGCPPPVPAEQGALLPFQPALAPAECQDAHLTPGHSAGLIALQHKAAIVGQHREPADGRNCLPCCLFFRLL